MKKLLLLLVCVVLCRAVSGDVLYNDGLEHIIDSYVFEEAIRIENEPFWGDNTTLSIYIGEFEKIYLHEDSAINFYGGYTSTLTSYGNNQINIFGGTVDSIDMFGEGNITITEGTISNLQLWQENSICVLHKCNFGDNAIVQVLQGEATLYGKDFFINGREFAMGSIPKTSEGLLEGKWLDGTPFKVRFENRNKFILLPYVDPHCVAYPTMDFNKDCIVNLFDFAMFASQWMQCNLYPQSLCLQ